MAITIEVQNISTRMDNSELQRILAAVQTQVLEDVAPSWLNEAVTFTLLAHEQPFSPGKNGAWRFIVADTPEQVGQDVPGALGDHDAEGGVPVGYAFVGITLDAGMKPSVTISHEVLEMIGDALIDQCNQWSDLPHALFLAQELCDPVEDDRFGYEKNGVLVSDFVTPAYFVPSSAGPWDFKGHLQAPNTLALGGYQLTWDPTNGWQQQFPQDGRAGRSAPGFATRYARRIRRMTKAQTRGIMATYQNR